jgi:hypothetical protein
MLITQWLFGMDQSTQISLHLFSNDVNILILCLVMWFLNVNQLNDIFMFKEL